MADVYSKISLAVIGCFAPMGAALAEPTFNEPNEQLDAELDLEPGTVDSSPVLQEWLREPPDVLDTIRNDPSFPSRLQLGYALFPSSRDDRGLAIGIEDIIVGELHLTVNAE